MYFPVHRSIQLISPTFNSESLYEKVHLVAHIETIRLNYNHHHLKNFNDLILNRRTISVYIFISVLAMVNCDGPVGSGSFPPKPKTMF